MAYNYYMKKIKSYSIVRSLDGLIALITVILVINTIMSLVSVRQIRSDNIQMISDTLSNYGIQEDSRFASARHFVEWSATKDPSMAHIKSEDSGEFFSHMITLRSRLNDMMFNTGDDFMFFLNLDPAHTESFHAISSINVPYDEYLTLKKNLVETSNRHAYLLRWSTVSTNENTYLYYMIKYRGVSLYSVIPVDALMQGLDSITTGKNGYVSFRLNGKQEFKKAGGKGGSGLSFFYKDFSYKYSRDGIPFTVRIHADVYSSYGEQLIKQLLIILILLLAVIISTVYITKLYRVIMMPLEEFSSQLSSVADDDGAVNTELSQITELAAANEKFKELTDEIKTLRIEMYEKELEKKKSQIIFLQHQIRPHFYLNCLSTIDSMAQLGNTEAVSDMVRFTSTYMRYLFQADRDFVRLEYELTHISAYINIQNLRMGDQFTYEEKVPASELSVMIPPLLLITFIENSVKHALAPSGEKLKLLIQVSDIGNGKEKIELADSGQGFDQASIRRLTEMASEPGNPAPFTADGHGIGISNSIKRLALLYNDSFSLSFFNGEGSYYPGAHIILIIPRKTDDTDADEVKME